MLSYILDDIKDLTNIRSLMLLKRVDGIKGCLQNLLDEIHYRRYCAELQYRLPTDIQASIVQRAYNLRNIAVIREQKRRKRSVICELNGRMEYYPFRSPVRISEKNLFYNEIVNKSESIIEVSKYCFKIEGDYVMGVYNLDMDRNATLCQFTYFCERLRDHLIDDTKLFIYPLEKQRLFHATPINAFRVLYYLYLARDKYLRDVKNCRMNQKDYIESIIKFMRKCGHNISSIRNTNDSMIFYST